MPFTPSHAVVALPFVRTPLVPAAIAIGAMAPDFPLFVRGLPLHYGRTHDFAWVPATVLLALGLLLVWRAVLRPAARELMPSWLAARLPGEWDRGAGAAARETLSIRRVSGPDGSRWRVSWSGMLLLAASLVLGVMSHIVWDLFTHEGRWGVSALPLLAEKWGPLQGFKWLQYGSGVIGLAIIGVWALSWLTRRDPSAPVVRVLPSAVRWVWWLSLPAALVLAWFAGLAAWGPLSDHFTVAHLAYRALPPATALWGAATIVLCVVVQVARTARRRARSRPGAAETP